MKKLAATLLLVMLTMAPFGKLAPLHAALAEQREMITLSFPPVGWPPYIISDLNNTGPGGILIEVFREICRVEGYELQMVTYPEKRGA